MGVRLKIWSWATAIMMLVGMLYAFAETTSLFERVICVNWGIWSLWAANKIQNYPEIEVSVIRGGQK